MQEALERTFGDEWAQLSESDRYLIVRDCTEDGGVEDLDEYRRNIGSGNLASYARVMRVRFERTGELDRRREQGMTQALAGELARTFEQKERGDGSLYTVSTDARVSGLGFAAHNHGEMLPDDWRYATIAAALDHIGDCDEHDCRDEHGHEFADGNVDTYNAARLSWLSSHLQRANYVDEAVEELGWPGNIMLAIGYGQYQESLEVWYQVHDWLAEQVEA